jgi:lipoprotein-anchoring transpeptidase ErfK/SrfK
LHTVRLRSLGVTAAALLIVLPVSATAVTLVSDIAHADAATAAYVPLASPTRLLDSRSSIGALGPGGVATITVTGEAPLPAPGLTVAAVLNITVVGPAGAGFWTVYPHGTPRPLAANLYVDERVALMGDGLAMANLVTVPVAADGSVDVFSQSGGQIVVDMLGSYQTSGATAAGRLQPLTAPQRILDTRSTAIVSPDSSITVNVPASGGAEAAVLTVTTIAIAPGFWTLYPTGTARPTSANLNSLYLWHVVANQVIVPLDPSGNFDVYSQGGGHVIVDLVGLVTGAGAPVSTDGLFVPLPSPTRFLDTRDPTLNPLGGSQNALPGWSFEVPVAVNPTINRSDVSAVALNVTVTDPLNNGYVSATPAGTNDPSVKSRSTATVSIVRAGQIVAGHAIVAVSTRGFDVFSLNGSNVIADVAGYYLGSPVPAPFAVAKNVNPTPFGCTGLPRQAVGSIVLGSSRAAVAAVQQRLLDLGFWLAAADGSYGLTTSQAVMAFQKWAGLPRSTQVDEATAVALDNTPCRPGPGITSGDLVEVDKGRQVMFIIRGGRAQWIVNVSTGGNYFYTATDHKTGEKIDGTAITPTGTFSVYRVADDPKYEGSLGTLYRPRFIVGGVAVHGYSSVPNYPASHGCIRVTNAAMDMIWGTNAMPQHSRVVIHD